MGIWETFCPICGLPCGYNYTERPKYLNWLDSITLLTAKNQKIQINLHGKGVEYEIQGTVFYDKVWYVFYKDEWPKSNHYVPISDFYKQTKIKELVNGEEFGDINYGLTSDSIAGQQIIETYSVHTSCYKLIKNKFNYDIKFCDLYKVTPYFNILKPAKYGKIYVKYADSQAFDFETISSNESILMDPLKNKENQDRIINIWTNLIAKFKKSKCRPSPSMSATLYEPGVIKYGNDGNLWIINKTKTTKAWIKLSESNVQLYFDRIAALKKKLESFKKRHNITNNIKRKSKSKSKSKESKRGGSKRKVSKRKISNNKHPSKRKANNKNIQKY